MPDTEPDTVPDFEPATTRSDLPRLVNELYWLLLTSICGFILVLVLLPPRLIRTEKARVIEEELRLKTELLSRREAALEKAIQALDTDPFYREEAFRRILEVKRPNEEYVLQPRTEKRKETP